LRTIFLKNKQVRAGWRLMLFCALVFGFGYVAHLIVRRLPLPEFAGLHPVGIIVDDAVLLLVAMAATGIMARHVAATRLGRRSLLETIAGAGIAPTKEFFIP
jgi:hypothetical protein